MELVKSRDSRYTDYENLLLRRDSLRKEGEQYALEYIRIFGDLMNEVFKKKIQCIEKKKKIAYCQARINKGLDIYEHELNLYIQSTMSEYYEQLETMISDTLAAKSGKAISVAERRRIKEIYRYLAKKIHPDKRPDLAGDETIRELWRQIVIAYTYNNLNDLEELKFKVDRYLESIGDDEFETEIPDIEDKIIKVTEEIQNIMDTNPYQYRYLLEDSIALEERKRELKEEFQNYTDYSNQLEEVLKQFKIVRLSS